MLEYVFVLFYFLLSSFNSLSLYISAATPSTTATTPIALPTPNDAPAFTVCCGVSGDENDGDVALLLVGTATSVSGTSLASSPPAPTRSASSVSSGAGASVSSKTRKTVTVEVWVTMEVSVMVGSTSTAAASSAGTGAGASPSGVTLAETAARRRAVTERMCARIVILVLFLVSRRVVREEIWLGFSCPLGTRGMQT